MPNPFDQFDGPAQQGPTVTPLPMSPKDQAREGRDISASNRDDTKTDIAVRGEGRDISKTRFEQADKLRGSFEQREAVKRYRTVLSQYAAGIGSGNNAVGDQKLINSYATMLNPTSTVQLGEYQATEQVDPYLVQIQNKLKKEFGWDGAGRLSEQARTWLGEEMFGLTVNANMAYNQDRQYFEGLATQYGYQPNEVVGPHIGDPFKTVIEDQRREYREGLGGEAEGDSYTTVNQRGEKVSFTVPPGSSHDQIRQAGIDATKNPALRGSPIEGGPTGYQDSYAGQGMSGVNEGIASTLGFPVDMLAAGMNLIPKGINAVAGTDLPMIEDPFGGSGTFRDMMTVPGYEAIYDETDDPAKQFTRRVGQSVGAAVAPAGLAGSLPRAGASLLAGAGGGVGGATAQQVFPGNPLAEMGGELLGGGLTGAGLLGSARRSATREIEAAVPTVPQLKQQAGDLYRQAESRGVTADPAQTTDLADTFRRTLSEGGQITPLGDLSPVYPKLGAAMNMADAYRGLPMSPTQMQTVRGVVTDGMASADRNESRLASALTDNFDDFANPLAPELPQARDMASRYLTAEKLEKARELAAARAGQFTGSGFENALRTEYRGLDRGAIKGSQRFNDDVGIAVETVNRGTPGSNFARGVGRFAPTGPVPVGMGAGVGALVGGPAGAAIGGTIGALGTAGRMTATRMGIRNADVAELIARNGGKLPEANVMTPELQQAIASLAAAESAKYITEKPKRRGLFGSTR